MVERATKPLVTNATSSRNQSGNANDERLLALEVRARRLAFAIFQGSGLLDWGARSYAAGPLGVESSIEKLRFLLHLYAPPVVIARRTRGAKDGSSQAAAHALRTIKTELKRRSVRLVVVERNDVRQFFAQYGCRAKHDIAALIVSQFPELKWRVPRPRRPWDPEAYAVAIFDAVATAVTFNNVPIVPEAVSANGVEGDIDGSSAGVRTE